MKKTLLPALAMLPALAFAQEAEKDSVVYDMVLWHKYASPLILPVDDVDSITFVKRIVTPPEEVDPSGEKLAAFMFYNEFVPDGGVLKVRGRGFTTGTQVQFEGVDGKSILATDVELVGYDGDELHVTVPAGVAHTSKVTFIRGEETYVCPIIFRDYRNMLIDFDDVQENMFQSGAIEKDTNGVYTMESSDEVFDWVKTAPANYSTGKGNKFAVFHNAENYEAVSFVPGKTTKTKPTVFGDFYKNGEVNAINADDYVIKFELFVDKDFPTNLAVYTFGIVSGNDNTLDNSRYFSACFQGSKVKWDRSGADGWVIPSENAADDFYTDGWMTVSIPLSQIKWNFGVCNYFGFAQNITENVWGENTPYGGISRPDQVYSTNDMKTYVQENAPAFEYARDMNNLFGGLVIQYNPWDGVYDYQSSTQNKAAHVAIDNIRIVPNDGNGAIYTREKYGVPSQHFFEAPRLHEFGK